MKCPKCRAENLADSSFCSECGAKIEVSCPACKAGNLPGAKFCRKCGERLGISERPSTNRISVEPRSYTPKHLAEKILTSRSALEGERKQVTVLFADVKGSMDLAEQVDAEEWHKIIDRFFAILSEGVHRFEGTINQYTGDGIMALFGAPIAHEDHARRACYAALHLNDNLRRYAEDLKRTRGLSFLVRIGINSGEVVVGRIGDDLRMDYTAQGQTVGLAARLEQLAAPGSAYLTDDTAKLVSGFFRLRDLGLFELKGVSAPIRAFELEGTSALRTPIEVSRSRGFSRFVGRVNEMASLEAALGRAIEGNGQVVGVVADPGLGKSRLCFEFAQRCRARGIAVYEAHGVPYGKAIPMLPILASLRGYFGITEQDTPRAARDKIAGRMVLLDETLAKELLIMFDFLGVPDPERPTPVDDPDARQRQFLELIRRLSRARSAQEPAVHLLEDLHWFDRASEEFLENLVDISPGNRTLVLLNFRPEFHASWMQRSYYQQLPLLPLGPEAIEELLRDLLGTDPSVASLGARIRDRTVGNPFFIEETVQTLAETGSLEGTKGAYQLLRPVAELVLPANVKAVLAARIDRLEEREKHVLQTASIIGRNFTEPILRRVVEVPETELMHALDKLVAAEFVFEQALYPQAEYIFKHALTQEVAYHSVLMDRRRVLHERAAQAVETLVGDSLEAHYGELAHHYKLSGNTEKAVEYLHRVGEQAADRSANAEAVANLTTALDLLPTLPDTIERDRRELALRTNLAGVLIATKGWGAPEREGLLTKARALCERLGESRQLGPVLSSLCQLHLQQDRFRAAGELAEQALRLGEDLQDSAFLSSAHYNLGESYYWTGELVRAEAHLKQALTLYDPTRLRSHAWVGVDLWIPSSSILAWTEHLIGRCDQALKRSLATLARAREEPSRIVEFTLAQGMAGVARQLRREGGLTLELADAAISLCATQGFSELLGICRWLRGCALSELGQEEEGIREMAAGIEGYRSCGSTVSVSWPLGLLASAHGKIGQLEQAFSVLAEGFEVVNQYGERFYEAELLRLKGELLLKRPAPDEEAEACFRQAIAVARRQSAKTWELRATTSLGRLLQKQGKKEQARKILAEIYGWFTEGFDTPDLKEAKGLLEELS
jgi:class 3 adenylate cyclase/tetratricopeptide (TPR) repeat protein